MLLLLQDVSKSFGGIKALENFNLKVEKGEILGLIGPNGSGKTTTFNIVCGTYKPDKGDVFFENMRITNLPPHVRAKLGIARTYQIVKPFNNMTVLENVITGALFGGSRTNYSEAVNKAKSIIEFVGLSGKAELYPYSLTLVDKKRLELARALASNPKLLLLDEVLSGLNPVEIQNAIKMVKKINDELGVTIIIVEHIMRVVMNICDRVVVLNFGRKIGEGKPIEIVKEQAVIDAYLGHQWLEFTG